MIVKFIDKIFEDKNMFIFGTILFLFGAILDMVYLWAPGFLILILSLLNRHKWYLDKS